MCGVFFFTLYGSKFTDYDDFSHWATVLKVVMRNNRLPNFEDANLVYFPSYPTGTAGFLYFFEKAAGLSSEWSQMFFQAALTVSMTLPLFAYAKSISGNITAAAISAMLTVSMPSSGTMPQNTLLVDGVLALSGLAAFSILIYQRENPAANDWIFSLFSSFIISVKNSGIFFVLPITVCYWLFIGDRRRNFKRIAFQAACPLVTLLLWQSHVKLVFSGGMNAKHSLSPSYMTEVLSGKTPADIKTECTLMLKNTFSPHNAALYLLPLAAVTCVLLVKIKKRGKSALKPLVFGAAMYFAYQIGLLGMYIFSMPTYEASYLASYPRYHLTILIYLAGAAAIPLLPLITFEKEKFKKNALSAGLALLSVASVAFAVKPDLSIYFKRAANGSGMEEGRAVFERIIEEEKIPQGASCLIISDKHDTGYYRFMARYLLLSKNSWAQGNDCSFEQKTKTVLETYRNYDYLLLIYPSSETGQWFAKTFRTSKDAVRVSDLPESIPLPARANGVQE